MYPAMYNNRRFFPGQKGLWAFYDALQASERWQRHSGRDHIWITSKLHPWIFSNILEPGQIDAGRTPVGSITRGNVHVYQIALNAMFAAVEERRIPETTGASTFFPLPYRVPKEEWWTDGIPQKDSFVSLIAGACAVKNHCDVCAKLGYSDPKSRPGSEPADLRKRLLSRFQSMCQQEQLNCPLDSLGNVLTPEGYVQCKIKSDRHKSFGEVNEFIKDSLERSKFCIVPR
eukprot:scaffold459_cov249-Pinguiococcus_pyrenoidosus.AAC.1